MGMKIVLIIMAVAAAFAAGTMGRVIMVENDNDAFKLTSDKVEESTEKESYAGEARAPTPKIEKFAVPEFTMLRKLSQNGDRKCSYIGIVCFYSAEHDKLHCIYEDENEYCICTSESRADIQTAYCILDTEDETEEDE